ncbi:hypothetical protein T07_6051 [Trichinella nelsoni]|uniref:Uncharacterized protein n=1 Tax=Trichinella nelsoni TaxID=6336 RepID=A0A0V0RZI4_9BILA|nr:hypothetical protein T07_6051 [Trichinella nelsoni]
MGAPRDENFVETLFFRLLWMCGESVLSRSFQVNGDVASCLPSGVGMITLSPCIKRSGIWRQVRKCSGGAERLRTDYAFFVRFLVIFFQNALLFKNTFGCGGDLLIPNVPSRCSPPLPYYWKRQHFSLKAHRLSS